MAKAGSKGSGNSLETQIEMHKYIEMRAKIPGELYSCVQVTAFLHFGDKSYRTSCIKLR